MFRTALLILSGNAAASLLLLVRNLVVARLIPIEDYGVAATFAVVMAMVEMASTLGLQQQIVQSKDGDDPRFQAALQGFQVLRGVVSGSVLFLIAGPIAFFLGIPEVIWAYQLLALVPVIKGFQHFDIYRVNRQMRFWPLMLTGGVPAFLSLLIVWPLVVWLGDWRVMLYAILAQITVMTITSHLVAERSYKIIFDATIMARSLRFGWPLLVNAILMFFVLQGDKLIVGRVLGMETLAIFAIGMTLTVAPTIVMAKSAQNFFLPKLSREIAKQEMNDRFVKLSHATLQVSIINGSIILLATYALSPYLVPLIFDGKYNELLTIITTLALLNAIRVFKSGPAQIALSQGQTANAMIGNSPRLLALPLAWWVLEAGGTIMHLLWLGVVAELTGYGLSLYLVRRRLDISLFPLRYVAVTASLFLFLSSKPVSLLWLEEDSYGFNWYLAFIIVPSFIALLISMAPLWKAVLEKRLRKRGQK